MSIETLDSSVQRTSLGGHLVSNFTINNPTKQAREKISIKCMFLNKTFLDPFDI